VLEEVHHEDERAAGERAAVVLVDSDVEEPVRELARSVQRVKTRLVGSRAHVGPFQRLARIFGTALSGSFSNSTGSAGKTCRAACKDWACAAAREDGTRAARDDRARAACAAREDRARAASQAIARSRLTRRRSRNGGVSLGPSGEG
jgi:hypothetical protein